MMPTPRNVVIDAELGVLGEQLMQRADVVEVRVGEPDPLEVGRVDDRPQSGHELVALHDGAGVDQDRLGTVEDEGVERDESEAGDREGRRQHVDVGRGRCRY